eukprot:Skav231986  [mRNA]  locus=scaffold719:222716:231601:- [translate_table: standard]
MVVLLEPEATRKAVRCVRFKNVPEGYTSSLMREELEAPSESAPFVARLRAAPNLCFREVIARGAANPDEFRRPAPGATGTWGASGQLPETKREARGAVKKTTGELHWIRWVLPHQRLTRLQLNDNPLVSELLEEYRPWILRLSPQLEELDNETVSEVERRGASPQLEFSSLSQATARQGFHRYTVEIDLPNPITTLEGLNGDADHQSGNVRPSMEGEHQIRAVFQAVDEVDAGVANREFFYILREMTKLQIYGCGGAPAGGWSGIWDCNGWACLCSLNLWQWRHPRC